MLNSAKIYVKICTAINNTKTVTLHEQSTYVKFQNFKRLLKAPFIIYADFDIISPYITNNKILLVFHNLENYDLHLAFQELGIFNPNRNKINTIPEQ